MREISEDQQFELLGLNLDIEHRNGQTFYHAKSRRSDVTAYHFFTNPLHPKSTEVCVYRAETLLWKLPKDESAEMIAVSPRGDFLAVATPGTHVEIWNLLTGEIFQTLPAAEESGITRLVFFLNIREPFTLVL